MPGMRAVAFTDTSGGSGADSMTLAVATGADNGAALLALREAHPPFSPDEVVAQFADLLHTYNIRHVTGDRYAGT